MKRRERTRHRRRVAGMTLVEVLIASVIGAATVGAGISLLNGGNELAASSIHSTSAARRGDSVIWPLVRDVRRSVLSTAQKADGTPFADGETDSFLAVQLAERWNGTAMEGARVEYALDVPPGATQGKLMRRQEGMPEQLIARGVLGFAVTRAGRRFTFRLTTVSGPTDDRRRRSVSTASASPRNP